MPSQRQFAQLECLPNEILDNIAGLLPLRSLLALAKASRRLYSIAVTHLGPYKALRITVTGRSNLSLPDLLIALLEDSRKAQYVAQWRIDTEYEWYNQQERVRQGDEVDSFAESEHEDEQGDDLHPGELAELRWRATDSRLLKLLETSPLIHDSLRAALCEAQSADCFASNHGLGLSLCHQLETLEMAHGDGLRFIMRYMPRLGQHLCLASLKSFTAWGYDGQYNVCCLSTILPLLVLPSLERLELHLAQTYPDTPMPTESCVSPLKSLILEGCCIQPQHLGLLLSSKPKRNTEAIGSDDNSGVQSLVYNFSLRAMIHEAGYPSFNAPAIIAAIRNHAGRSLVALDFNCDEASWNYTEGFFDPPAPESTSKDPGSWDMTREDNLRVGFTRLREVVLGPELLVGGWCSPVTKRPMWVWKWGLETPWLPATIDPMVESLSLATVLPETIEVLKLRHFNTTVHPLAAPLVLEKLMIHLRTGMESTPKLREVHLMDPQSWDDEIPSTPEFEASVDEFAKLCETRHVLLARGMTPAARKFCNHENYQHDDR